MIGQLGCRDLRTGKHRQVSSVAVSKLVAKAEGGSRLER